LADDAGVIADSGISFRHRLADDLGPFLAPHGQQRTGFLAFAVDHARVGQRRAQQTRMAVGIVVHRFQGGDDALLKRAAAPALAQMRIQLAPRIFDEGQKAGALVGIVQIEGAVAEARLARNVLRPCRVIAALDKQFARSLLQPRKALRLAAPAQIFNSYSDLSHKPLFPEATFGAADQTVNAAILSVYTACTLSHTRNGKHPAFV